MRKMKSKLIYSLLFLFLLTSITTIGLLIFETKNFKNDGLIIYLHASIYLNLATAFIIVFYKGLKDLAEEYYSIKDIIEEEEMLKSIELNENSLVHEELNLKDYSDSIKDIKSLLKKEDEVQNVSKELLSIISKSLELVQAEIFLKKHINDEAIYLYSSYAYYNPEGKPHEFKIGEGLVGQVVKVGDMLNLKGISSNYMTVASGLGNCTPTNIIIAAIKTDHNMIGAFELASFKMFDSKDEEFISNVSELYHTYLIEKLYSSNNSDTNE